MESIQTDWQLIQTEILIWTADHEVSSTLSTTTEDRQWYKERKMEEDKRQREFDREAAKEKQRDREEKQRDREDRMQANLLMAGGNQLRNIKEYRETWNVDGNVRKC